MSDEQATAAIELAEKIAPLLAGHPPEVQSAVLADLTAMWLAGHQDFFHPESDDVKKLRRQLFARWCEMVLDLVPINVARLLERAQKQ
jgi:hypothetical protein